MKIAGIYRIALADGRCYIGQSVDIVARWRGHRQALRTGTHGGRYLMNAWRKHGAEAFTFEVVEECAITDLDRMAAKRLLTNREQWWIDNSHAVFNTQPAAAGPLGVIRSADYRAKISRLHKGRVHTPEAKAKMGREPGFTVSAVTRAKLSEAGRGRPQTPEHAEKRAAAQRGRPSAQRGVPKSPAHCAALSAALMGHAVSADTRSAVAEANRARVVSPETRAKMSRSMKAARAAKREGARPSV